MPGHRVVSCANAGENNALTAFTGHCQKRPQADGHTFVGLNVLNCNTELLGRSIYKNNNDQRELEFILHKESSGFRPFENDLEMNEHTNFKVRHNVF
jgi:hypothetical protein